MLFLFLAGSWPEGSFGSHGDQGGQHCSGIAAEGRSTGLLSAYCCFAIAAEAFALLLGASLAGVAEAKARRKQPLRTPGCAVLKSRRKQRMASSAWRSHAMQCPGRYSSGIIRIRLS